jgi:hypothetical protein
VANIRCKIKIKELAMGHIIKRVALLVAAFVIVALPVLAEDTPENQLMEPAQNAGKVECLLVAVNSCDRVGTFQSRIDRIRNEINKGSAVYSKDELIILNNELDNANRDLVDAYGGGA